MVFLESLLFHYIMIDIGYDEKNQISFYYNGLISILLPWKYSQVNNYALKRIYLLADTELALCFGKGQSTESSYHKHHFVYKVCSFGIGTRGLQTKLGKFFWDAFCAVKLEKEN